MKSPVAVLVNNFNRAATLRRLVRWLLHEASGVSRIYIVDNASTYAPTLRLYDELSRDVVVLAMSQKLLNA